MKSPIQLGITQFGDKFPKLAEDVEAHMVLVEYRINSPGDAVRLDDPNPLKCIIHAPDVEDDDFLEIVKIASDSCRAIAVNTHARPNDSEWLCSGCSRLRLAISSHGECEHCGETDPDCWKGSLTFEQTCEKLNIASDILSRTGKTLLIENTYESPELILRLLEALPMVDFTLDTGHSVLYSNGPKEYLNISANRLAHMHLHDNKGGDSERFHDLHLPPGEGVVDWDDFAESLAGFRYASTAVFECVPDQDWLNSWVNKLNSLYNKI